MFLIVIDWVIRRTVQGGGKGLSWREALRLDDLDDADDIALISSTVQQIQQKTNRLVEQANVWVRQLINTEKCNAPTGQIPCKKIQHDL